MVCIRMIQIQRTREHCTKLHEGGSRLWWSYCQVVLVLQDPDLTNSSPSQEAAEGLFAFAMGAFWLSPRSQPQPSSLHLGRHHGHD